MRLGASAWILAFAGALPSECKAQPSPFQLQYAETPRLVDCSLGARSTPCFRIKLNIVDRQGSPAAVELPPPARLADSIKVSVDGQPVTPFYAGAQGEHYQQRPRLALILVDISGSMKLPVSGGQSRFEAAKSSVMQFLAGFQNGVDRVAVVPFESHNVEAGIRSAVFASTRDEALAQVNALPQPGPKNNTALYSAVATGVDVLSRAGAKRPNGEEPPETLLIIMTDGKNEVYRGDDPGLLDGPEGLAQASRTVHSSGIEAFGIGFGNRSGIDEQALSSLSTKVYMASDAGQLNKIFSEARTLLNSRVVATFQSPWNDRASLAGRTLAMRSELHLPDGSVLASKPVNWAPPQMNQPVYEGECGEAERAALYQKTTPAGPDWWVILRPMLVFIGFGSILVVLWFWIPRLIWPEQYVGIVPTTAKWSNKAGPRRPAGMPPGFGTQSGGKGPQRAPSDATIVQRNPEFTKTRLDNM
jgi:Ca-activated chloride channel family protein